MISMDPRDWSRQFDDYPEFLQILQGVSDSPEFLESLELFRFRRVFQTITSFSDSAEFSNTIRSGLANYHQRSRTPPP